MGIKVLVTSSPRNRVSINDQQRESIRTVGIAPVASQNYLSGLLDVNASDPDNNETLVYDVDSGKYVIKVLPAIDGGTF